MTTKYFNVKVGLTTGNITLDATSGNITSTNASLGNLVVANYFSGAGDLLSNIVGGNVTGQVANALVAGTVLANAQPNITSVGTLTSLTSGLITATSGGIKVGNIQDPSGTNTITLASGTVTMIGNLQVGTGGTGNVTATYFIGNGSQLTGLPATYANSNVAAYLPTYIGNITGNIVTLTGNVTAINASLGNLVTANYFSGAGNLLSNIQGANVTGTVGSATTAGTVTVNAQPNITSVGTLTSLLVTGNVTATNASLGNLVTANYFSGAGNLLSNIAGGNVSGQVGNALVAGTVYTAEQPNITSLGTLSGLTVTGDSVLTGNLTVTGTTSYVNSTNTYIEDPIIEQGGGVNNATLTSDDGKDRGSVLDYFSTTAKKAFMGWDNSNAEFALGSVVTVASEVVTFSTFGNLRVGYIIGNGSALTSLTGANVTGTVSSATTAGTVTTAAQPNITSVGTLTSLLVTGNVTATNASLGNLVTANYFSGAGNLLSNIVGGNVTGQVANALVSGTVYTNAQPNITSVGTLSTLVIGNSTANVTITTGAGNGFVTATGNITAPYFIGNVVGNISGTLTVPGNNTAVLFNQVGAAGASDAFKFDYVSNALTLTGNLTTTNASLGNLVTSNYFSGAGNLLSNIQGANVSGTVGSATTAGTVTTAAQPNITSLGTLTSLLVTGNLTSTNASLGNLVTANYFSGSGNLLSNIQGANVSGAVSSATAATTAGTVTTSAQPNITSTGTLVSLSVTGNTTSGNVKVSGGVLSSRSNVSIPGTSTDTIIDQFPTTSFRSAKYYITGKGTNGYQTAEILLVQDGTNSYITIYGSICSNNTADILNFSSNIDGVSGNVRVYANTVSASTTVNLIPIYLND